MADKVEIGLSVSGLTVYFHVRNSSGNLWNGASFEAYSSGNWETYDVALTEQGASRVYLADFPSAIGAGIYSVTCYEQAGGSPAETDSLVGSSAAIWDGSTFVDVSDLKTHGDGNWKTIEQTVVAAAVLATPANPLATDGSGNVTVGDSSKAALASATATAARTEMDSNSTKLASIVDDTNELQGDLEDGGRLDLKLDSILGDTSELQTDLKAGGRLSLLANAIKAATDDLKDGERLDVIWAAMKVVLDRLSAMLSLDEGVYQWTGNSLELGPGATADATSAKQDTIIAAIGDLEDPTLAQIASAVVGKAVDGTLTMAQALTLCVAVLSGKAVRTATDPGTIEFYKDDDETVAITLAHQLDASGRVND